MCSLMSSLMPVQSGIGCDSHVVRCVVAFHLVQCDGPHPGPHLTERTMREWVNRYQFMDVNKLFGCCGQLFGSNIPLSGSVDDKKLDMLVQQTAYAIHDHCHKPMQVELMFSLINGLRNHYRHVAEVKGPKKRYTGSNSDDEKITERLRKEKMEELSDDASVGSISVLGFRHVYRHKKKTPLMCDEDKADSSSDDDDNDLDKY